MQDLLEREPKTGAQTIHREGPIARSIEQQTAKVPSDTFLWAALGSIALSLTFQVLGDEKKGEFRRALGSHDPNSWTLQQIGEIARLRGRLAFPTCRSQSSLAGSESPSLNLFNSW